MMIVLGAMSIILVILSMSLLLSEARKMIWDHRTWEQEHTDHCDRIEKATTRIENAAQVLSDDAQVVSMKRYEPEEIAHIG